MRFPHDLPNKPLSSYDRENKADHFKINKTLELWFLWSFVADASGRHKPAAGGFCLDLMLKFSGRRVLCM
jgi:hypothetical protein